MLSQVVNTNTFSISFQLSLSPLSQFLNVYAFKFINFSQRLTIFCLYAQKSVPFAQIQISINVTFSQLYSVQHMCTKLYVFVYVNIYPYLHLNVSHSIPLTAFSRFPVSYFSTNHLSPELPVILHPFSITEQSILHSLQQ